MRSLPPFLTTTISRQLHAWSRNAHAARRVGGGNRRRSNWTVTLLSLAIVAALHSSRARAGEHHDGLMFDIRKIVATQEDLGWKIDKYEIEQMMPDALMSLCRVKKPVRAAVLLRAKTWRNKKGGSLKEAVAAGRNLKRSLSFFTHRASTTSSRPRTSERKVNAH